MKKLIAFTTAVLLTFSLATGAFAAGSPASQINPDDVKVDTTVTDPVVVTVPDTVKAADTTVQTVEDKNDSQKVTEAVNTAADQLKAQADAKAADQATEVAQEVTKKADATTTTVFQETVGDKPVGTQAVESALKVIYQENAAVAAQDAVLNDKGTADVVVAVEKVEIKIAVPDVGLNGEDVNAKAAAQAADDSEKIAAAITDALANGTITGLTGTTDGKKPTVTIMGAFELAPVLSVTTKVKVNGNEMAATTKNVSIDNTTDGVKSAVTDALGGEEGKVYVGIAVAKAEDGKLYALMHYADGSWQVVDGVQYDAETKQLVGNLSVAKYFSAFAIAEIAAPGPDEPKEDNGGDDDDDNDDDNNDANTDANTNTNTDTTNSTTGVTTGTTTAGTAASAAATAAGSGIRRSPKTGDYSCQLF